MWVLSGFMADSDSWKNSTGGLSPDQFLTTIDPITITAGSAVTLTYQVGTYEVTGNFLADRFQVYLTTSNDPAVIITNAPIRDNQIDELITANAGDGSDSVIELTEDISAFGGQTLYLTFRHFDTFNNNSILLDNVAIADDVLSVDDPVFNGFSQFVDRDNNLHLSANKTMNHLRLFNAAGQEVVSQKLNNTNLSISLSALASGVYVASVNIKSQSKSFKIIKQ